MELANQVCGILINLLQETHIAHQRHLRWLWLHVGNHTYDSTRSTSGSPVPTVSLKLMVTLIPTLSLLSLLTLLTLSVPVKQVHKTIPTMPYLRTHCIMDCYWLSACARPNWLPGVWCLYSTPQCSHCKRCTSYSNSVRLSICLPHAGIVSKRRHVARCNLHIR